MKLPYTRKTLEDWAGPQVFRDAMKLWERGGVVHAEIDDGTLQGKLSIGSRELRTSVDVLKDGSAESHCPCHDNRERGIICSHVIALGLEVLRRAYDPQREEKLLEEQRKASRLAALEDGVFLRRVPPETPGATPARFHLGLEEHWEIPYRSEGTIPVRCEVGVDGRRCGIEALPKDADYTFNPVDESVLFVLEDICEGPCRTEVGLRPADFGNLLDLMRGRTMDLPGQPDVITVNAAKLASHLRVDLDRETGEVIVLLHTEMPFMKAGEFPVYVVNNRTGWAYGAGNLWPLESILPGPLQVIYREPMVIPRPAVPRFLDAELPLLAEQMTVETDLSLDQLAIDLETPRFRLTLKGSPAALAATLVADYGDVLLTVNKTDANGLFAHPDPEDLWRYTVRNQPIELRALERINLGGFEGLAGDALEPITGTREVRNFLGSQLPAVRRKGWRVELEGRIAETMEKTEFVTPVVDVHEGSKGSGFDVSFRFDDGAGGRVAPSEIRRALNKGESYLEHKGRTFLIDGTAIDSMNQVFEDCASGEGDVPGSFRLEAVHAAYVKSSLDALDGIDIESAPTWRERAEKQNHQMGIEPIPLPESLEQTLRPYQKDGVNWLGFLERGYLGGILADEMGLGKTLQTLAWLQSKRFHEAAQGRASLIVCPTSLVENWAEEAARFTPDLRVTLISGAKRAERFAEIPDSDLVVTSYALLRRDIKEYQRHTFAAAVLDEAQHIKNHSTQNSKAAKMIQAEHRVVLTGTPIENSVMDLWSIMDFLMPTYLGGHKQFRERYETPISKGDKDGEEAQARLRRKLQPFLLRRLKKDVAKDLPPKIQRIARFTMSPDQQAVYQDLLQASQRRLQNLVAQNGFQKSRMEILTTLLRLRQVCCHLDLLKKPELKAERPSAKVELFLELLDEALDGGHRMLLFSQFTSMLAILREALEARGLPYCYLDGSTKNRMDQVRMFNTNREIPVFLISLKAGGTGLNLTGADMVIHFDPWWNPAVEDQATDRAYRIGQKRTVYSVKLIARDSVEEKVLEMQRKKQSVIDATLASDDQVMQKMDWDDVKELLGM